MTEDRWEDGGRAARWVRLSSGLERQLQPVGDLLLNTASPPPGARVLDIGCGTGPTTRDFAAAVGPGGNVTGLDISTEMITAASAAPIPDAAAPIEWVVGDATTWTRDTPFDLIVSRFGVMFFADPTAAFANLARLGGQLCMAVWAERTHSPWAQLPVSVTVDVLAKAGIEPDIPPPDGGPHSLGNEPATTAMLNAAGWHEVGCQHHQIDLTIFGGMSPSEAAPLAADFGAVKTILSDIDESLRTKVFDTLTKAYGEHTNAAGHVVLESEVCVFRATSPKQQ